MKIRKAVLSDVKAIFNLGKSVDEFQVSDEVVTFWPEDILKNCINSETSLLLVAEFNDQISGFIIINYNPSFKKAIIENIYVCPKFRKQGIGRQLLNSALAEIQRFGCEYVCAVVEEKNNAAIEFYTKSGFSKGIGCVWLDKILNEAFSIDKTAQLRFEK